ncbi:MAG TPA: magnesium transporter [Sedimentisphaerales bacterium]|nr:magnesium transporter [Sedimentisphaerales bacterium]
MHEVIASGQLRAMLMEQDRDELSSLLDRLRPVTTAGLCGELTADETWRLLDFTPLERQAEVFSLLSATKQVEMVGDVGRDRMSRLLEAMPHDDRVDLLKRLDPLVVENLLPLVPLTDRQDIRNLLQYPEHSAGALMTTDYVSVQAELTVAESMAFLRQQARSRETIYYIYVVDDEHHLVGIASLRDLILADPDALIGDIMDREVISVSACQDQEHVALQMAKFDFLAIPVVDGEMRLVGIVTHDDVIDVVVEEATEDALRMGSVGAMAESYLAAPFTTVWRKRAAWLACLFAAELLTFSALAHFQEAIAAVVVLSLFVPLCISTGGNSGSQAATLVTRALALGEIGVADWWRILRREVVMGLALGVTLGAIGFIRAAATPHTVLGNVHRWTLALVIAQAVAAICLWGTLVGAILPLVFKRAGIDPAYASSPFVATLVDVTGIVIYFSIASAYLL